MNLSTPHISAVLPCGEVDGSPMTFSKSLNLANGHVQPSKLEVCRIPNMTDAMNFQRDHCIVDRRKPLG